MNRTPFQPVPAAAAVLALFLALPASAHTVRVTADRVNMRAKPGFDNSEVLGQLAYDQRLEAQSADGEWVGVVPPPSLGLWVRGDYVSSPDRIVTATRLNVRAGPSANYTVVATLEQGAGVEVRRELDGWLEIAPPRDVLVWVFKDYVAPLDAPSGIGETPPLSLVAADAPPAEPPAKPKKPRRPAKSAPAEPAADSPRLEPPAVAPLPSPMPLPDPLPLPPDTTTNAAALASPPPNARNPHYTRPADSPSTPVSVPRLVTLPPAPAAAAPSPIVAPSAPAAGAADSPLPASFKLVPLPGQGKTAVYEGVLRAAPLFNDGPTRYRVLVWQDNRWQILCHVFGEATKFRALQNKSVRVRGREYWVQDTSAPVLVPEQIQELLPNK